MLLNGVQMITHTRLQAASAGSKLEDVEASVLAMPLNRDSLVARRVRLAAIDTALFEGETSMLAAAQLAERLSDVVQASRAQVNNLRLTGDSTRATSIAPVQVHALVTGDWPAIARVLVKLESDRKLMAVREVTLNAADQPSTPTQPLLLHADLVISGLARIEPSARVRQ